MPQTNNTPTARITTFLSNASSYGKHLQEGPMITIIQCLQNLSQEGGVEVRERFGQDICEYYVTLECTHSDRLSHIFAKVSGGRNINAT